VDLQVPSLHVWRAGSNHWRIPHTRFVLLCRARSHARAFPSCGPCAQAKSLPGGQKSSGSKGAWPVKATAVFIDLLKNALANGVNRNLDVDNLVITHIQSNHAPYMRRRTYRAHGRINAYMSCPAHIELVCVDAASAVKKAPEADGKVVVPSRKKLAQQRVAARGD
jgi:large subunit ribosomal protein L17e